MGVIETQKEKWEIGRKNECLGAFKNEKIQIDM